MFQIERPAHGRRVAIVAGLARRTDSDSRWEATRAAIPKGEIQEHAPLPRATRSDGGDPLEDRGDERRRRERHATAITAVPEDYGNQFVAFCGRLGVA